MMKKLVSLTLVTTLVWSLSVSAKTEPAEGKCKVVHADSLTSVSTNSLVYFLPKTALNIHVTSEKTTKVRGPFYQYSERYLGLTDVVTKDETTFELAGVELETIGVPDANQSYAIIAEGGATLPSVSYAKNGCIASVNGKAMKIKKEIIRELGGNAQDLTFDFVPYTDEMLMANSTAKMALEAANYIKRIRENRTLLISGESTLTPADGQAFQLALDKMDELELQFLELFKGKVVKEMVTENITYMADTVVNREIIFRFSKFNGVVAKDDLSGAPVNLSVNLCDFKALPNQKPQKEYDSKGRLVKDIPDAGLYYVLPGTVEVSLALNREIISTEKVAMAQFGQVLNLPPALLLNSEKGIYFNPVTGALISIH